MEEGEILGVLNRIMIRRKQGLSQKQNLLTIREIK